MGLLAVAIVVITILTLLAMGRPAMCSCGTVKLWYGEINTAEDSQHIADWYTLSHVIHGFLLYWLLWWCSRAFRPLKPPMNRFALAVLAESAWEIFENTPLVINRYRDATIALGYTGDSVVNSTGDILAMSLGFLLALRLPVWLIIAVALCFEVLAALVIRDNLTLNILMLTFPVEAVHQWQLAAP
jgi:hypothetical protein